EACQREGEPYEPIRGWASKQADQALRMAGVLALFEGSAVTEIGLAAVKAGIAMAQWFGDEWLRVATRAVAPPENEKAERVLTWLRRRFGTKGDTFSARDICRSGVLKT